MKEVWIAYTDGPYGRDYSGSGYPSTSIEIKSIFDTELGCRRFCMENDNNLKCKNFKVRVQEEEVGESACEI